MLQQSMSIALNLGKFYSVFFILRKVGVFQGLNCYLVSNLTICYNSFLIFNRLYLLEKYNDYVVEPILNSFE